MAKNRYFRGDLVRVDPDCALLRESNHASDTVFAVDGWAPPPLAVQGMPGREDFDDQYFLNPPLAAGISAKYLRPALP